MKVCYSAGQRPTFKCAFIRVTAKQKFNLFIFQETRAVSVHVMWRCQVHRQTINSNKFLPNFLRLVARSFFQPLWLSSLPHLSGLAPPSVCRAVDKQSLCAHRVRCEPSISLLYGRPVTVAMYQGGGSSSSSAATASCRRARVADVTTFDRRALSACIRTAGVVSAVDGAYV